MRINEHNRRAFAEGKISNADLSNLADKEHASISIFIFKLCNDNLQKTWVKFEKLDLNIKSLKEIVSIFIDCYGSTSYGKRSLVIAKLP
jgi:hypothetical protein